MINDTKKDETIIVCVCTHNDTVPVRPVGPAPLPSTSVAVSTISGSGSADNNTASITSSSAQPNSKQGNADCFYRGMKLNLSELCRLNSSLKQYFLKYGKRHYRYVKCELCEKYEHVATKHSKMEPVLWPAEYVLMTEQVWKWLLTIYFHNVIQL